MKEVKIKLGKTEFEFRFGLWFFGELKDNHGIGMEEIQVRIKENPFKLVPVLMLEAAKYSAKRKGKKFNHTEFDFVDAIDDDGGISSDGFLEFIEAFTDSMTKDVPKEPVTKKKKNQRK